MNAFVAKCTLRKRYIVIYSDLLDVYYSHKQNELVRFVLAHELAHHKCGHTNLCRLILAPALKPLFLDKSLTRAQEYTADRTAVYYAEEGALDLSDHPVGYRRMQALKEAKRKWMGCPWGNVIGKVNCAIYFELRRWHFL